jgi:CubicO group peptidase (beta-lactamase class C family)
MATESNIGREVLQLCSITRQLPAALVLVLTEERRLSPDAAVADQLPDFVKLPPDLTVRQLRQVCSMRSELRL